MKKITLVLILLFLLQISYSQQIDSPTIKWERNSFSVGFGVCGLCGTVTGGYERLFMPQTLYPIDQENGKSQTEQWLVRIESGYYGSIDYEASLLIVPQVGYMRSIGNNKNNIEAGAGFALLTFLPSYAEPEIPNLLGGSNIRPAAYIGYRRQKPDKRRFFRVGASYPQGGYFSVGLYTKNR